MIISRERYLESIIERLSLLKSNIEIDNRNLRYGMNRAAEDFYANFLNLVYDYDLSNGNDEVHNLAAIDLIDVKNRIAIQVTSSTSFEKVKETLKKYEEKSFRGKPFIEQFDRLIILIITNKKSHRATYSGLSEKNIRFNPNEDIWDVNDIIAKLSSSNYPLAKLKEIAKFLEDNIAFQQGITGESTVHYSSSLKKWTDNNEKFSGYQKYVERLYTNPEPRNKLLGEESLSDLYMEQRYYESEKEFGDVDQLIEDFCSTGKNGVLWIVGEPGHGKTSMCIKAVADYIYRKRYQSVNGVFWFCLNPQRIPQMIENSKLTLQKAFSWNPTSGSCSKVIEPDEINGSLVFLDGFDELKSSIEKSNISSNQFYSQVNEMAELYNMHIIVTSRRQALEQEKCCKEDNLKRGVGKISCTFRNGSTQDNDVKLLAPMSYEKQIEWIDGLIKCREKKFRDTSEIVKYRQRFPTLHKNSNIAQLFNIPILLRMIVQNCFEPTSGNRVELYRDLFNNTLIRQGLENDIDNLLDIYRKIAYKIFVFDNDSAEISKDEFKKLDSIDAYLYQYYLYTPKAKEKSDNDDTYRVAFLHRSFYQYFLSEFFYEKLIAVKDIKSGEELLKLLWPRHLEQYVLENLQVMTKIDTIQHSGIIEAVNNTDCFFQDYANKQESSDIVGNYDRANNSFWNILSILNYIIPVEEKNASVLSERIIKLLSLFNCNNINLSDFVLESVDLNDARLVFADLSGTDLSYADLCSARLDLADLRFTKMNGADLVSASLFSSDLSNSDLSYADLSGANLNSAYMNYTTLSDTILCNTNLRAADLSDADLCNANLVGAILENTKMVGANVENARVTKSQYAYVLNQGVKNLDKIIVEE